MGIRDITFEKAFTPTGASPDEQFDLPREEIFQILSNNRRRCTIRFLEQHDEEWVSLREIVDSVTAWENDMPIEEIDSDTRKCVYTALRQSHLPKLADTGIIEYDQLRGEARLTGTADELFRYLDGPYSQSSWHRYYVGLAAGVSLIAGANWLGLAPIALVSWPALTAGTIVAFATIAVVHAVTVHSLTSTHAAGADVPPVDR